MAASKNRTIDVRPLIDQGGEPFALIRAQADRLAPGATLTVIAPFLPSPLIELLKGEGFQVVLEHRGDGAWAVNFRRG